MHNYYRTSNTDTKLSAIYSICHKKIYLFKKLPPTRVHLVPKFNGLVAYEHDEIRSLCCRLTP